MKVAYIVDTGEVLACSSLSFLKRVIKKYYSHRKVLFSRKKLIKYYTSL